MLALAYSHIILIGMSARSVVRIRRGYYNSLFSRLHREIRRDLKDGQNNNITFTGCGVNLRLFSFEQNR